jgi:hypothetical protein
VACVLLTDDKYASKNRDKIEAKKMADSIQMVVYKNGIIRLIDIKNLQEAKGASKYSLKDTESRNLDDKDLIDSIDLLPGEEMTCGSLSPDN